MWRVYKTRSVPFEFRRNSDEFVQELIRLWDEHDRKGVCYTVYLYTLPAGFILLEENSAELRTIRGLWVKPSFRGEGAGQALMKSVLKDCDDLHIQVNVNITDGAQGFYEKFGFEIGERRTDFPDQIRAVRKAE